MVSLSDKRIEFYRNELKSKPNADSRYFKYTFNWWFSDWLDIFILLPLIEKFDVNYIESISFFRCLQLIRNMGQNNEWKNAQTWYEQKSEELKRNQEKKGTIAVNQDEIIDEYMNRNDSDYNKKMNEIFGGF